jgi:endo-1,4-beta-xylanase
MALSLSLKAMPWLPWPRTIPSSYAATTWSGIVNYHHGVFLIFPYPPWMLIVPVSSGTWTSETLTAVLTTHITTEVTHYKGQCYAWDVVNEALNDDTDATFRANVFYNTIGEDYIRIAFETAAAADPDAKLYYNDYSIESAGAKATAALNIVKSLKASGTKIDGVGFESHFIVGSTPSTAAIMSSMEAFIALGVEVAITELDIRMKLPSTTALLTQQSIDYQNAVSACIAVADCVGVTVWDFDDKVCSLRSC